MALVECLASLEEERHPLPPGILDKHGKGCKRCAETVWWDRLVVNIACAKKTTQVNKNESPFPSSGWQEKALQATHILSHCMLERVESIRQPKATGWLKKAFADLLRISYHNGLPRGAM